MRISRPRARTWLDLVSELSEQQTHSLLENKARSWSARHSMKFQLQIRNMIPKRMLAGPSKSWLVVQAKEEEMTSLYKIKRAVRTLGQRHCAKSSSRPHSYRSSRCSRQLMKASTQKETR